MNRILAQAQKELTQILRDPTALTLAALLPVLLMTLLGKSISLEVRDIPVVICDYDQTPVSIRLADACRASLTFRVVPWPVNRKPTLALDENFARAVIIIPQQFEQDVWAGRTAHLQMMIDATDANTANVLRASMRALTQQFSERLTHRKVLAANVPVTPEIRLWYNPGRRDADFIGSGSFVVALSLLPPLIAALAMSR